MEALKASRPPDSGHRDDSVPAPATGLIRSMASAFGRLKMPGGTSIVGGCVQANTRAL